MRDGIERRHARSLARARAPSVIYAPRDSDLQPCPFYVGFGLQAGPKWFLSFSRRFYAASLLGISRESEQRRRSREFENSQRGNRTERNSGRELKTQSTSRRVLRRRVRYERVSFRGSNVAFLRTRSLTRPLMREIRNEIQMYAFRSPPTRTCIAPVTLSLSLI